MHAPTDEVEPRVSDRSEVGLKPAAPPGAVWPERERRRGPRLFRHHEARGEWKHAAVYAPVLLLVIVVGALAIWSFLERQSLVVQPAPLPGVTVVTANPNSALTASWVRMLGNAQVQPTLVPLDKADALQGVVVLCDVPVIPPALQNRLGDLLRRGGSIAVIGIPPSNPVAGMQLSADGGMSDSAFKFSEGASPILARLQPGHLVQVRRAPAAFLKETPRMTVDARWNTNARAAVMHMENGRSRILWFGFDPQALAGQDGQLQVLVRNALRWAAGQPISEGAVGPAQVASFTPTAREAAHADGFAWSVDRIDDSDLRVQIDNRGRSSLRNPTVEIWMPPGAQHASVGGDLFMRRGVIVRDAPDPGACLLSVVKLDPNETRVLKVGIR